MNEGNRRIAEETDKLWNFVHGLVQEFIKHGHTGTDHPCCYKCKVVSEFYALTIISPSTDTEKKIDTKEH